MSGWDLDLKTGGGSRTEFAKFPEGITRIRMVDEEPSVRWQHWMPEHSRGITCPGRGCPICEIRAKQKAAKEPVTYNIGRRFAFNAINRENGQLEIVDQGVNFIRDLKDIKQDLEKEGSTLLEADIRVRRRGTGKDGTSYRLDVGDVGPLTEKELELVANKPDLSQFFAPPTIEQITKLLNGEKFEDVMRREEEDEEVFEVE